MGESLERKKISWKKKGFSRSNFWHPERNKKIVEKNLWVSETQFPEGRATQFFWPELKHPCRNKLECLERSWRNVRKHMSEWVFLFATVLHPNGRKSCRIIGTLFHSPATISFTSRSQWHNISPSHWWELRSIDPILLGNSPSILRIARSIGEIYSESEMTQPTKLIHSSRKFPSFHRQLNSTAIFRVRGWNKLGSLPLSFVVSQ